MKQGTRFGFAISIAAALLAVGCGGGGGGGGETVGGIDRGGITIASGPINGFGSVIVNGVHYATAGASIIIDDQPGAESDLRVGQVVRVEGTVDASGITGTARSIRYDDVVEGPVQGIDVAASRLVVLGQTIVVGAGTSYDDAIVPRGLEGLVVGDHVEVSGLVDSSGLISATRIERKSAAGSFEVKGIASAVDTVARRFTINALVVDYSAAQLSGFASGQPANGDLLEAKGTVNGSGVFVATSLERESASLAGGIDDDADLEGLVTRFASVADFDVAGQRVTTTAATRYEGGTVADLALDVNVEVEGGFDATGRIVAAEIEFRRAGDVEVTAQVESVSASAGTLTVLGQVVRTTAITRFEDKSDADVERFSLADLGVGDWVSIHAYGDSGGLVATLLEREEPQARVELQGTANDVAEPGFSIAGVAVATDAQTEFRNTNGEPITAAAFFAAAAGREVKVRGTLVGNTVLAERAELED
ncbi:MAG: DUF5666 domain-containing protein [Steroidobacteraceae bacterium]